MKTEGQKRTAELNTFDERFSLLGNYDVGSWFGFGRSTEPQITEGPINLDTWGVSIKPGLEIAHNVRLCTEEIGQILPGRGYASETVIAACVWLINEFKERCRLNKSAFDSVDTSQDDFYMDDVLGAAITGTATPEQRLSLREALGMGNVELGRVSAPITRRRIQLVHEMRAAIGEAIDALGERVIDSDPEIEIKASERAGDHTVYLLSVKRIVGLLPDGTKIAEKDAYVMESSMVVEKALLPAIVSEPKTYNLILLSSVCYAYKKPTSKDF